MQEDVLSIERILHHGTQTYPESEVVTAAGALLRRTNFVTLGERVARLAGALRSLGVTGDQRVATFSWNNQEHLEAYLAVPSMGAVLHTLNIRLFPDQIAYIANHAEDSVIILDSALAEVFAKVLPMLKTVHTVLVTGHCDAGRIEGCGKQILSYEEALAAERPEFGWPDLDERSAAAMCYTSGTTGNPKGVVYSHRSTWIHSAMVCSGSALGLRYDDRVLPVVPMFHANAWGLPYAAIMAGASLILPDRFLQAEPLVALIETERPTISGAVPTIWTDVLEYLGRNPSHDISCLRVVACGGSAVPRRLMETFEQRYGVQILQAWGMTETSPVASIAYPPVHAQGEESWRYRDTAGRPLCSVESRIVDDKGIPLPRDGKSIGELQVRGPCVAASYYADENTEKFDNGWLCTGDVGTIDSRGYISLTDRAKDVIKSGGEWISSVELETTLAAHPAVLEAAVIGIPDDRWQERPLAAIVLREHETATPTDLREWLSTRVARWWLPDLWAFIQSVPRTSVGKFDKKLLREQYAAGELAIEASTPSAESHA